jgi:hypothetical protein
MMLMDAKIAMIFRMSTPILIYLIVARSSDGSCIEIIRAVAIK